MLIKVRIIVKGLVQGVGFRYFALKRAREYGINGYAKNLYNGDVEIEAEGEKNLINELIRDLKIGPSRSRVTALNVEEVVNENKYEDFSIV